MNSPKPTIVAAGWLGRAFSVKSGRAACYFLGFVLQRCAQLLLLPLFVAKFSAEDFARYGLMQSVLQLAPAILTLRLHTSIGRLIYDSKVYDKSELLASSLVGGGIPVVCFGLLAVGATLLGLSTDPVTLGLPLLAFALSVSLLSRVVTEFTSILYRAEGDGPRFLMITVTDGVLFAAFCLLVLLSSSPSYSAVMLAIAWAGGLTTFGCLVMVSREISTWSPQWPIVRDCLSYSWPTAVHVVGVWFSIQSARWIGASKLGLAAMASFTLVMLIVSVVSIITRTVFEIERPTIGKLFAKGEYKSGNLALGRCRQRAIVTAFILCIVMGIGYVFAASYLPASFKVTGPMFTFVSLFVIVDAMSLKSTNLLLALKKSRGLMIGSLSGGVVAILSAPPLCDAFGVSGLCSSLFFAAIVQAALSEWVGRQGLQVALQTAA